MPSVQEKKESILKYRESGFQTLLVHGVDEQGVCLCREGKACTNPGKHPMRVNWKTENVSDGDLVRYPKANIGIATGKRSGAFVLDYDPRHGGDKSRERLIAAHGPFPKTVTAETGGGGFHEFYKYPEGKHIKNAIDLFEGIDVRSDDGLVVAPPSDHSSGKQYKWRDGHGPGEIEIAEAPDWLLHYVVTGNSKVYTPAEKLPDIIPDGQRNATMTSLAGTMRRRGASADAILAALRVENERCDPELEDDILVKIAKSISRYEPAPPKLEWNEETKQALLESVSNLKDFTMVFQEDMLSKMALASRYDPITFSIVKQKLKGKVNLKDLEKSVRFHSRSFEEKPSDFNPMLVLDGLDSTNIEVPKGLDISMEGISRTSASGGVEYETMVCFTPVIISRRFVNMDSGLEKVELNFYRDSHWKTVLAPRSVVFNKNSILKLADQGLPVSSNTSAEFISYMTDYEQANDENIPVIKSVSRLGWLKDGSFFPFQNKGYEFESDSKESATIKEGLETCGDMSTWLDTAKKARANPAARFLFGASFASVLLEILHKRVFFIHLWHNSRSGKTATLKFAISVWGNPYKLMGSFNSTIVGLERMASSLRNMPFAIDELQVLNTKRMSVDSVIYMLAQGQGRTRGGRDGGLQETLTWRNIMMTTGEEAMISNSAQDGANSRTFEMYAKPVDELELASKMHEVSEQHFGHAGRVFIEKLAGVKPKELNDLYDGIKARLQEKYPQSVHLSEVAVVCLGDYLSSMYVFGE